MTVTKDTTNAYPLLGTLRSQVRAWASPEIRRQLLAFDGELKEKGLNPGSLADIMVAVALLSELSRFSCTTDDKG